MNKNQKASNQMTSLKFGKFLSGIPEIVSNVVYNLMGETNKIPRFSSVFKIVKEELNHYGYNYTKDLTELQKSDLEAMARDAYEGMREAGF